MTHETIKRVHHHIRREIRHSREVAELNPAAHLRNDYRAQDLDVIELVLVLEDEWGITISDDDIARLATVADVEKLVLAKLGAEAVRP